MNAVATGTGANKYFLIVLMKMTPRMAAGRNASTRFKVKQLRLALARQRRDHRPKPLTVQPANRQDGGKLDHDLENLALLVIPIEQAADDDQVPGARDRQEFRQPFDHSQYQGLDRNYEIHVPAVTDNYSPKKKPRPP